MSDETKTLRRDAAENRQRLLEAAEIVFAEHGLDGSVEEIARLAGVGMGTLYRRFPTKDALIAELVRELMLEVRELAQQAAADDTGRGLEQFLYTSASVHRTHRGCLARLWADPETAALKDEVRATLADMLASAQAHGTVRADATIGDIDLVFRALPGVIEATQDLGDVGWRRFLAIAVAGLSGEQATAASPLPQPPLTAKQTHYLRAKPNVTTKTNAAQVH